MSNASQTSAGPSARGGSTQALCLLVLAVYTPLAAYLFRATQHTGDGAAYTLQAAGGAALDRAVHGGWLVPLSGWTRALEWLGVAPSAATNLLSLIAMGGALAGIAVLGAELAAGRGRRWDGLLAPATAMGAVVVWDAATFCEIYGPLAAFCVGAVLAGRRGRWPAAAAWLFLALATHPGALALLPGLLVLGSRAPDGSQPAQPQWAQVGLAGAGALALAALWVLLLGPDAWLGPRGILAPGADVGPWQALQRAWRLLARDLGITALPLLIGAVAAWSGDDAPRRRWLLGVGLLLGGTVVGLDRFSDNPAGLPLFLLACPLAALAPSAVRTLPSRARRASVVLLGAILVLGVAEATTRQDAVARRAVREQALRAEQCAQPPEAWAERMLLALACD